MASPVKTLEAIKFDKEKVSLQILDQLLLPYTTHYLDIKTIEDAFQAIRLMQVRGAPAIAIVGAFAIVVDTNVYLKSGGNKTLSKLFDSIDYLVTSRPTAVNLANALNDIKKLVSAKFGQNYIVDEEVYQIIFKYSVALYEDDLANNFKIGANGLNYIVDTLKKDGFKGAFSIVTICNTGSLATSGHGTALGIIRSTYDKLKKSESSEEFWLDHVYPCETRPYNQGAKLTTYELHYEQIPFTLICDNMVSSLVNTLSSNKNIKDNTAAPVKFIIVGADRVVENGDTANKIGTFQLSTIANFFNSNKLADTANTIKFIVAAPRTTIDLNTATGDEIVIEERPANELTTLKGPVLMEDGSVGVKHIVGIATPGISVWNPAFDVTPHALIDAIVTEEEKVYTKNSQGEFKLSK